MKMLKTILFLILLPVILFNRIFGKKCYCFFNPTGNNGNTKELYNYFNLKGEECYLIDKDKFSNMVNWIKYLLLLSRAKCLFLTHGLGGVPITWMLTCRVQLWHGLPMKKILLHNDSDCYANNKISFLIYKLRLKFSYNYLVTGNGIAADNLISSFGYKERKILRYGNPCHKVINCTSSNDIIFIPTWREKEESTVEFIKLLLNKDLGFFIRTKYSKAILCPHPFDEKIYGLYENELLLNGFIISKFNYDLISKCKMVVTDYSSVIFDYSARDISTIIFAPDLDDYINNGRDLYEYYYDFIDAKNIKELIFSISKVSSKSKNKLSNLYNSNIDSCELIYKNFS